MRVTVLQSPRGCAENVPHKEETHSSPQMWKEMVWFWPLLEASTEK